MTIKNCLITKNTAIVAGGIYSSGSSVDISNCIFLHNNSEEIVSFLASEVVVTNSTFYDTESEENRLAVDNTFANPVIINSIFFGEDRRDNIEIAGFDVTTVNYSNTTQDIVGDGNINADPMFVDPENADFRLKARSPSIDAGDPTIFDPDGSRSDMGAYGGPGAADW